MKKRRRISLATALALSFGGLILVAVVTVSAIALLAGARNAVELSLRLANNAIASVEGDIRQHLQPADDLARFIDRALIEGRLSIDDPQSFQAFFQVGRAAAPQIIGAAYFAPDLRIVAYGEAFAGDRVVSDDYSDRPDFQLYRDAAEARPGESWYRMSWIEELNRPAIVMTRSLQQDGHFAGIVSILVSVESLSERLSSVPFAGQGSYFVLHGQGQVLAHPSMTGGLRGRSVEAPLPALNELDDPALAMLWTAEIADFGENEQSGGLLGRIAKTGAGDFLLVLKPLSLFDESTIYVGIKLPLEQADQIFGLIQEAGIASAVILSIALLLAIALGRAVARPANRLAVTANAVRRLDLAGAPPVPRSRLLELDRAAQAVNALLKAMEWFLAYLPKRQVLRLLEEGERAGFLHEREVTIFFSDIAGFTAWAENRAAGEVAERLNVYFDLVVREVEASGGTIDKFIGDGVMAFWGAPDIQRDHAKRALDAATKIARATEVLNAKARQAGHPILRLRIGLHSGQVLVGNVGTSERLNYTAIGDPVNVAQRLESLGHHYLDHEDVVILFSEQTRLAAGGEHPAETIGEVSLTGRRQSLVAHRLEWKKEALAGD